MKKTVITIIIILIVVVGAGFGLFYHMDHNGAFDTKSFPSDTTINQIDCSGMSLEEAEEALIKEWQNHKFKFTEEDSEIGSISISDFTYDIANELQAARQDQFLRTALNYYLKQPLELTIDMTVSKTGSSFEKNLKQADYLKEKNITKTRDAYIDLSSSDLEIIPEVYGNNIDYTLLTETICDKVAAGKFQLEYMKESFYCQPSVTAESEDLLKRQEIYKEHLVSKVTYILGKDTVSISPEALIDIYNIDLTSSGSMSEDEIKNLETAFSPEHIDENAVKAYAQQFARDYNTFGGTRKFTSYSGNKIKVSGGNYGYALNVDEEAKQLIEDLKSGKEVKREPIWLMIGYTDYNLTNDIGDTYVEISIKKQHLWFFKDGKKVIDCDVVTGNPYMGYETPTGTFALTYKQAGATLRGENADGSKYESPVSYWMPFYGNYGMHDAPWRSSFGGNIYLGGGSHGCVNMPVKAAKKVFENIDNSKVPIIVY